MTTFEQLTQELDDYGCFDKSIHTAITMGAKCISQHTPDKMKLMMAAAELVLFTAQLRKPILMSSGTIVPINFYSFTLAGSGQSKDSSLEQIRASIVPAYNLLDTLREKYARKLAEDTALVNDGNISNWKAYFIKPSPIFVGIGTGEGQIDHWSDLQSNEYGAGYVQESELGTALLNNKNMPDNIEALAKVYDLGNLPPKVVKDKSKQTNPIKGFPVCLNMFGTDQQILYNRIINSKFKEEFTSKLARRSFVFYNNDAIKPIEYPDKESRLNAKREAINAAKAAREALSDAFVDIVETTTHEPLVLSTEAEDCYFTYQDYNEHKSLLIPHTHPITAIHVKHNHWKTQKLAGALAILEQSDTIELSHMVSAIRFTELFTPDMYAFETELDKEPYELFADYTKSLVSPTEHKIFTSIHQLRKLGFIKSSNSKVQVQELITNASSYNKDGIYSSLDDGIMYEHIFKTPVNGISTKKVNSKAVKNESTNNGHTKTLEKLKGQLAASTRDGYTYTEATFEEIGNILKEDIAYSPFEFDNGVRGNSTIIGGCKWAAFDVDDGKLSAEEMHKLLGNYNHHIALTSNSNDDFRYRVLIEFDQFVDISDKAWLYFMQSIGDELLIKVDSLAKGQIMFSYAADTVYSTTDANTLETREHIMYALAQVENKPKVDLTDKQKKALLADSMETFDYAYNLPHEGPGVKTLISVAFKAHELGASIDEIRAILEDINSYWVDPLSEERMQQQVYTVLDRL